MSGMAQEVFDLTAEQREIRDVCREFAAREIRPISQAVDEADTEMPWEVWYKAAELGLTSFMLPSEFGGGGLTDCLTACIVQEELCFGCSGIGNLITSGGFLKMRFDWWASIFETRLRRIPRTRKTGWRLRCLFLGGGHIGENAHDIALLRDQQFLTIELR